MTDINKATELLDNIKEEISAVEEIISSADTSSAAPNPAPEAVPMPVPDLVPEQEPIPAPAPEAGAVPEMPTEAAPAAPTFSPDADPAPTTPTTFEAVEVPQMDPADLTGTGFENMDNPAAIPTTEPPLLEDDDFNNSTLSAPAAPNVPAAPAPELEVAAESVTETIDPIGIPDPNANLEATPESAPSLEPEAVPMPVPDLAPEMPAEPAPEAESDSEIPAVPPLATPMADADGTAPHAGVSSADALNDILGADSSLPSEKQEQE